MEKGVKKTKFLFKEKQGFTLIELLVVIAIIAVLVTIVLVAINPLARIQEAQQRDAQSKVRQVAQAMEACYSAVLGSSAAANSAAANALCNTTGELTTGSYLKTVPSGITVDSTDLTNATLCAWASGGGRVFVYKNLKTANNDAGKVFDAGVAPGAVPGDCTSAL